MPLTTIKPLRKISLIEIVPDHLKAALRAGVASRGIGFLNHFVCINVSKAHLVV